MILITEWTKEGKILCDEDNSTPKIDGWKKFNTLKYYKVEDGAEMTLLEHQNCRTLPRSPNGKHYHTQLYSAACRINVQGNVVYCLDIQ